MSFDVTETQMRIQLHDLLSHNPERRLMPSHDVLCKNLFGCRCSSQPRERACPASGALALIYACRCAGRSQDRHGQRQRQRARVQNLAKYGEICAGKNGRLRERTYTSRGWGINLPGRNCEFGMKRWERTACSEGDNSAPILSPIELNAACKRDVRSDM